MNKADIINGAFQPRIDELRKKLDAEFLHGARITEEEFVPLWCEMMFLDSLRESLLKDKPNDPDN